MPTHPDKKLLRSETAIDQRTFTPQRREVGIDDQTVDQIWADILAIGKQFRRNIADVHLKRAMQSRRGEIIVTRSQLTQDSRAQAFHLKLHEKPATTLPYAQTDAVLPRESTTRSLSTARHARHTHVYTPIKPEQPILKAKILALGGFTTNLGERYRRREKAAERLERMRQNQQERRKRETPNDDIPF